MSGLWAFVVEGILLSFISLGPAFITELWCLASKEAFAMPKSYIWGTMSLMGGTEFGELKTFLEFRMLHKRTHIR